MPQPLEEPARQGNIGAAKVSGDSLRNGNLIGQQNGYVVRPQSKLLCLMVDNLTLMANDNQAVAGNIGFAHQRRTGDVIYHHNILLPDGIEVADIRMRRVYFYICFHNDMLLLAVQR